MFFRSKEAPVLHCSSSPEYQSTGCLGEMETNHSSIWLGTVFCTFCRSHSFKSCSPVSSGVYTGIFVHASIFDLLIIPVLVFLLQISTELPPLYGACVLLRALKSVIRAIPVENVGVLPAARLSCGGHIPLLGRVLSHPTTAFPGPGHCTCGSW